MSSIFQTLTAGAFTALLSITSPAVTAADQPVSSPFVEGLLSETSYKVIHEAMAEHFPSEAAELRAHLSRTAANVGIDDSERVSEHQLSEMHSVVKEFYGAFYNHYGPNVYFASDEALKAILKGHVETLKYLQPHGNDCSISLVLGSESPLIETEIPYSMLSKGAENNFVALHEGTYRPIHRAEMTEFPDALGQQIMADIDAEEVALLQAPEIDNPKTCSGSMKILENTLMATGPGAEYNRASTVQMLFTLGAARN